MLLKMNRRLYSLCLCAPTSAVYISTYKCAPHDDRVAQMKNAQSFIKDVWWRDRHIYMYTSTKYVLRAYKQVLYIDRRWKNIDIKYFCTFLLEQTDGLNIYKTHTLFMELKAQIKLCICFQSKTIDDTGWDEVEKLFLESYFPQLRSRKYKTNQYKCVYFMKSCSARSIRWSLSRKSQVHLVLGVGVPENLKI